MMPEVVFVSLRRRGKIRPPETFLGWVLEILGFAAFIIGALIDKKDASKDSLRKILSTALYILGVVLIFGSGIADLLLKK